MTLMRADRIAGFIALALMLFLAGVAAMGLLRPHPAASRAAPGAFEAGAGIAADRLPGPVPALTLKVVDGDTVHVRANVWVGQTVDVAVRLHGVDAPELSGKCDEERTLAQDARAWLDREIGGAPVVLTHIEGGKYFGRVVANVVTADGRSAGAGLLAAGLARPYGGGRRQGWCAATQ